MSENNNTYFIDPESASEKEARSLYANLAFLFTHLQVVSEELASFRSSLSHWVNQARSGTHK